MRSAFIISALLVATCACVSADQASLSEWTTEHGLVISADDPPEGAAPLSLLTMQRTGFYLFGIVPFAPVRLEDCLEGLAEQAMGVGADGIANVIVLFEPAAMWRFAVFPIPDWSASITLTGVSYRLPRDAVAPAPEKDPPSAPDRR